MSGASSSLGAGTDSCVLSVDRGGSTLHESAVRAGGAVRGAVFPEESRSTDSDQNTNTLTIYSVECWSHKIQHKIDEHALAHRAQNLAHRLRLTGAPRMPRASHAARTALALAPIARWREVISLNHVELNVGALGAGLVEPVEKEQRPTRHQRLTQHAVERGAARLVLEAQVGVNVVRPPIAARPRAPPTRRA